MAVSEWTPGDSPVARKGRVKCNQCRLCGSFRRRVREPLRRYARL